MNQRTDNESMSLTAEQWQGLARLGDLGNQLSRFLDGPMAGVVTDTLNRMGNATAEYDVPALASHLLRTLQVLDRAGVLRLMAENAEWTVTTLESLGPTLGQWIVTLQQMPIDELRADAESLLKTLHRLRLIGDFVEHQLAGTLTSGIAQGSAFVTRNDTDKALIGLLELLGRLHRNGTLDRVGDLTDYLAGLDEGMTLDSFAERLLQQSSHPRIDQMMHLVHSAEEAMQDAEKDEAHLGGIGGLMHLLRDKQVQKGLRMLSVLPAYMNRPKPNGHATGSGNGNPEQTPHPVRPH